MYPVITWFYLWTITLYLNTLTFHLQDSNFGKSKKWQEKRGSTGAEIKDSEQVMGIWLEATQRWNPRRHFSFVNGDFFLISSICFMVLIISCDCYLLNNHSKSFKMMDRNWISMQFLECLAKVWGKSVPFSVKLWWWAACIHAWTSFSPFNGIAVWHL